MESGVLPRKRVITREVRCPPRLFEFRRVDCGDMKLCFKVCISVSVCDFPFPEKREMRQCPRTIELAQDIVQF